VSRYDNERLDDIVAALDAIASHLDRGPLDDDLVYDAVRVRLIEIGEAVKSIEAELLKNEPGIPWAQIAKMRDKLAHHYFDASHQIIRDTIDNDLAELRAAVTRLRRNPRN